MNNELMDIVDKEKDDVPNEPNIYYLVQFTRHQIEHLSDGITWNEHSTESCHLNSLVCFAHYVCDDLSGLTTQEEKHVFFYKENANTSLWTEFQEPHSFPEYKF